MRPFHTLLFSILIVSGCSYLSLEGTLMNDPDNSTIKPTTTPIDSSFFYYNYDQKVYLKERTDLIFLQFADNSSQTRLLSGTPYTSSLIEWNTGNNHSIFRNTLSNATILQFTTGAISEEVMDEIRGDASVSFFSHPVEHMDHTIIVLDDFAVKIKQSTSYTKLESLAEKYGCEIYQQEWFDDDIFFLRVPCDSGHETISLAALFYETDLFEFTSPNFMELDHLMSDPYYSDQWGLTYTGQYGTYGHSINIASAWNITEGSSNVIIAVVDDGVELTHPDLSANLVSGYTYDQNTAGAPSDGDNHGTAVAGIIGAVKDNSIGIRGVAPGCKIMPIRTGGTYEGCTAGIDWARDNGASVINCSWVFAAECPLLTSAINNAASLGRNGKGCVIICSAGNYNTNFVYYPASLATTFAVGAGSFDGKRKTPYSPDGENWGSSYGSSLDIIAPGVKIPTTDRLGDDGYNTSSSIGNYTDTDYTKAFGKTSAAAPYASGVAALIISEYPDLTQGEVRRAIQLGCQKYGSYVFTTDYGIPAGTRNDEVGYGFLDAYSSLRKADWIHNKNVLDATSGFDFIINNYSSYLVDDIYINLTGIIGGYFTTLISCDPGGVNAGESYGYPFYRGESIVASPGSTISSIQLEFYASSPDCPGNLRIGVAIDNSLPTYYYNFSFGYGDTYLYGLPNSTVPDSSRRMLYINILDPM